MGEILLLKKKKRKEKIGSKGGGEIDYKRTAQGNYWGKKIVRYMTVGMVTCFHVFIKIHRTLCQKSNTCCLQSKFIKIFTYITSPCSFLYEKDNDVN